MREYTKTQMNPITQNTLRNTKDISKQETNTHNIIMDRECLIKKLIQLSISDNLFDTISLYLMEFVKLAMEHREKVSKDG